VVRQLRSARAARRDDEVPLSDDRAVPLLRSMRSASEPWFVPLPMGAVLVALPVVPEGLMVPALPEVPGLVDVLPLGVVAEVEPEPAGAVDGFPALPAPTLSVEVVPDVLPDEVLPDCAWATPSAASREAMAAAAERREERRFMDGSPVQIAG
jgi:hypothetical protein